MHVYLERKHSHTKQHG